MIVRYSVFDNWCYRSIINSYLKNFSFTKKLNIKFFCCDYNYFIFAILTNAIDRIHYLQNDFSDNFLKIILFRVCARVLYMLWLTDKQLVCENNIKRFLRANRRKKPPRSFRNATNLKGLAFFYINFYQVELKLLIAYYAQPRKVAKEFRTRKRNFVKTLQRGPGNRKLAHKEIPYNDVLLSPVIDSFNRYV